jgi:hypothetical protein
MVYIGIDFSLNSPGVCVKEHNGKYHFISFFNFGNRIWGEKKTPKAFQVHEDLANTDTIIAIPYYRNIIESDFMKREREKLIDGKNIADLIINFLGTLYGTINTKIALEGFSYGSKGNSFIDIVQYNTFLRSMLLDAYGADNIYIMQPKHVKKLAGHGNANKHIMVKAFQDNVLNDKDLVKTKFWKWIKEKDFSEKIPAPISDLVDSYFVLNCIK